MVAQRQLMSSNTRTNTDHRARQHLAPGASAGRDPRRYLRLGVVITVVASSLVIVGLLEPRLLRDVAFALALALLLPGALLAIGARHLGPAPRDERTTAGTQLGSDPEQSAARSTGART